MPLRDEQPIVVRHLVIDGSHFFVGHEGEKTEGLCVGSRNMKEAYEQVGPVLSFLLKANFGLRIVCEPKLPYSEYERLFLASINRGLAQGRSGVRPKCPRVSGSREDTKLWATTATAARNLCTHAS